MLIILLSGIFVLIATSPSFAESASNGEVTISWKPIKKPKYVKCAYQTITVSSNVKIWSASLAIGGVDSRYRDVGLPDEISYFPSVVYHMDEINPGFTKKDKMLICNNMTKATLSPYFVEFLYSYSIDSSIQDPSIIIKKKYKFK